MAYYQEGLKSQAFKDIRILDLVLLLATQPQSHWTKILFPHLFNRHEAVGRFISRSTFEAFTRGQ